MTHGKPSPLVRLLPSLTDVAFLLPVAFLFLYLDGARTLLGDGDTGWHVRTGEWMLQNGRVPHTDLFSYTKPGQPWFAWEWLWDLWFGWLHQHWGMAAVVLASILVICLTFALLFRLVRRTCGNAFLAIGVTAIAAAGSSIHFLARPHLFTLLFTVIFYGILERANRGQSRWLWLLPALMVLWTNLHGGFLIGLLMIAAYAAGEAAAWLLDADPARRRAAVERGRRLAAAGGLCFAATFVNPYFYHLHAHIYQYLRDPFLWRTIEEFRPVDFQSPAALYFEPMFFLGIAATAWTLYQKRFGHALLLAGFAHMSLFAVRNLPIFLLIAAPLIAEMLEELLARLREAPLAGWVRRAAARFEATAAEFGSVDALPRWHVCSVVAAAALAAAFYLPAASYKFRAEYDPAKYPSKALAVLRSPESHRIFAHDQWGDYLIYNLYPFKKVFVDGRSDFYGASFDEKYIDVMSVKYDWEQNLSRYDVDTIVLPVDAALTGALKQSQKWRVVYDDGVAIVFRGGAPSKAPGSAVAKHRSPGAPYTEIRNPGATRSHRSPATLAVLKTRS